VEAEGVSCCRAHCCAGKVTVRPSFACYPHHRSSGAFHVSGSPQSFSNTGIYIGDILPSCAHIAIGCNRFFGRNNHMIHIYHDLARTDGYLARGHHLFFFPQHQRDRRHEIGDEIHERREGTLGQRAKGNPTPIPDGNGIIHQRGTWARASRGRSRVPGEESVIVTLSVSESRREMPWKVERERSQGKCEIRGIGFGNRMTVAHDVPAVKFGSAAR
jgi:hypothetical protein